MLFRDFVQRIMFWGAQVLPSLDGDTLGHLIARTDIILGFSERAIQRPNK
jgi:hypothetical protein